MENFLKPFSEKGLVSSLGKLQVTADGLSEHNIKLFQKVIFKPEVLVSFKELLHAACSPEQFAVKNDIAKNIVCHLNKLLSSDDVDVHIKTDIFCCVFQSFARCCKIDETLPIMQFFIVLTHVLGVNAAPVTPETKEAGACDLLLNMNNFNNAFHFVTVISSEDSFVIFKQLLFNLTKTSIKVNSSEFQSYNKWLHQLFRGLANHEPFHNIFLEIFLLAADIDLKFLEGNIESIFKNILSQRLPLDKTTTFYDSYANFLENTFKTFAKFQRTPKFIIGFLSSIKVIPTFLSKEIILPLNVINELSKTIAIASSQQSLTFLDILVQTIDDCFINISQNTSVPKLFLYVTSEVLISFFKNVKLYAPSITANMLQLFIDKLAVFKGSLQNFGNYTFSNKSFIVQNEDIMKLFLELCFYYGEIQVLINCYKDFILKPSDTAESTTDDNFQFCITLEQWNKLIKFVLKSELQTCSTVCFQLALQKVRTCRLENKISNIDSSTLKIIMHQLTSDLNKFSIIQQVSPEDFTILLHVLTAKQTKLMMQNVLKQLLKNDNKLETTAWLSHSELQENLMFVVSLFSDLLKDTQSLMLNVISEKSQPKLSWLLEEYFDKQNSICVDSLERLPEKINLLLKNFKKIRKFDDRKLNQKDHLRRIVEIFELLPLAHMKHDFRKLGLCFVVGLGTFLSDDDCSINLVFKSICKFLTSDTDASTCFDIGLCLKWLCELSYENGMSDLKMKVIESLVRNSPGMKFGLSQMGEMIESRETSKLESPRKMLETRVVLYNELGKCWQRAKKRKGDNDLIGSYRTKLAKMITVEVKDLPNNYINPENYKLLLKIFTIELNKAMKNNKENEMAMLVEQKFSSYFEFVLKNTTRKLDEPSASFLTAVLQSFPQIQNFLPKDTFLKIWKVLRGHEKVNWRLFCNKSSEKEFREILDDLLIMSKNFLDPSSDEHTSNCFEIWVSFFVFGKESKKNSCQLHLQEFFNYVSDSHLFLRELPVKKKIFLIKFFTFCLINKEFNMTSYVLDIAFDVILESLDDSISISDFHDLFTVDVEASSAILSKQFAWSRCKVHLTFVTYKRLLNAVMKRCNISEEINKDDLIKLSICTFYLEKWTSLIIRREKDFARTAAYFITALISSIASVTVIPAIKFHLINCINHFLSISDAHTVAYLMRILKPGYQQVFTAVYNQFKKYHKYSGKI